MAIRIIIPGSRWNGTAAAPGRGGVSTLPSFSFPSDGAVVISGATRAATATSHGSTASAAGSSGVVDVSLFDGEITASSVGVKASALAGHGAATGGISEVSILNLQALGQHITGGRAALGGWGTLSVDKRTLDTTGPAGAKAFNASVSGLVVSLSKPHGGLPAGTRIEIAVAQAGSLVAPLTPVSPGTSRVDPLPGDRPQLLPATTGPLLGVHQVLLPPLTAGPFVFPVFGHTSYSDDFGTLAPGVSYVHGTTIHGSLGEPLVAVATGTLFDVGWSRSGGNRMWLRDRAGNAFYYAHLSAFATLAVEGARVQAGQVIGFMGDTGEVQGAPMVLGFEVHPVSLLYLAAQGAVDPNPYLATWRPVGSVALTSGPGWAPSVPGTMRAPEPGAVLVSSSDISSAGALGSAVLRRALGTSNSG